MRRARKQADQHIASLSLRRHPHLNLRVEAARPTQRRIERVGPIRRAQDQHRPRATLPTVGSSPAPRDRSEMAPNPVHLGQEEREQPSLGGAAAAAALGVARPAEAVDLVNKEHRRRASSRVGKRRGEGGLRVTVNAREQLRRADLLDVDSQRRAQRACDQSLAGAGRAVKQHAGGRRDPKLGKQLAARQRKLDRFADGGHDCRHARHHVRHRHAGL